MWLVYAVVVANAIAFTGVTSFLPEMVVEVSARHGAALMFHSGSQTGGSYCVHSNLGSQRTTPGGQWACLAARSR